MKQPSTYISSIPLCLLLLAIAFQGFAQEQDPNIPIDDRVETQLPQDTIQRVEEPVVDSEELPEEDFVKVKDTTNYPFLTEIHIMGDYGKLLTLPFGFERKYEGGAQLLFENRYLLSLSYGYGSVWPKNAYKNVSYNAAGRYIKPGVFYQMSINPANKISAGFQYGMATFEDSGNTTIESRTGLFEPYERGFSRSSLTASWWELAVQSESKLRGNLWGGFRVSFRKLIHFDNSGDPDVFVVPGYGRTNTGSMPALNLYIKYKLSFFKPPVPVVAPIEDEL